MLLYTTKYVVSIFAGENSMEDVLTLFGQRLKELRKAKKLTQKELADLLEMTDRNYQRLEYGKINVSATVLVFLADFFHVTTDYLLGRD
jgi:transcriptional regulator with XRE-family HTH domain